MSLYASGPLLAVLHLDGLELQEPPHHLGVRYNVTSPKGPSLMTWAETVYTLHQSVTPPFPLLYFFVACFTICNYLFACLQLCSLFSVRMDTL